MVWDEFFIYAGNQVEIWISGGDTGQCCDCRSVNLEIQKEKMVMISLQNEVHKEFTEILALTLDKC